MPKAIAPNAADPQAGTPKAPHAVRRGAQGSTTQSAWMIAALQ